MLQELGKYDWYLKKQGGAREEQKHKIFKKFLVLYSLQKVLIYKETYILLKELRKIVILQLYRRVVNLQPCRNYVEELWLFVTTS